MTSGVRIATLFFTRSGGMSPPERVDDAVESQRLAQSSKSSPWRCRTRRARPASARTRRISAEPDAVEPPPRGSVHDVESLAERGGLVTAAADLELREDAEVHGSSVAAATGS
jgi:hypothetical protein